MHDFSNGASMASSLCKDFDIVLLQGHWLLPNNMHVLNDVDENFQSYGISAMNERVSAGILTGRPFSGVAQIFWHKSLSSYIRVVEFDVTDGKFISFKLSTDSMSDIIITLCCIFSLCCSNE